MSWVAPGSVARAVDQDFKYRPVGRAYKDGTIIIPTTVMVRPHPVGLGEMHLFLGWWSGMDS